MKIKKILLPCLLLATALATAQNVAIPDANFKAALVSNTAINTNNDTEIQVSEAVAFTKGIELYDKSIKSLLGIEAFVSITSLNCSSNHLTSLNISKNINLKTLSCYYNQLSSLDISKNVNLEYLDCAMNQLTSLDVSKNVNLVYLDCFSNPLMGLNVSNNINLTNFSCSFTQLTSLDVSKNINLVYLSCSENQLTSLDISKNVNLTTLYCSENQLTSLDVSKNVNITFISCLMNRLTNLDVSKNAKLKKIYCNFNASLATICININQNTSDWVKDEHAVYSTSCVLTGIEEIITLTPKVLIRTYNVQGQVVAIGSKGLLIKVYTDGSKEKIVVE